LLDLVKEINTVKERINMACEATIMGIFFGVAAIGTFTLAEMIRPLIYSFK
jgi:hypothetical protein